MFQKHEPELYKDVLQGVKMKTLCYGAKTLMTEFQLGKDSNLPLHWHPYEQTGYLVKGHIVLTIGENEYDVTAGGSWCIPDNVVHGARILEDSVAVEVFSPVRADYLPQEGK